MKRKPSRSKKMDSGSVQNRCIWMTAGVISFKLCPLDYDCENCDFDEAMRSQVVSKRTRSKAGTPAQSENLSRASGKIEKSLPFFTFSIGEEKQLYLQSSHLWMRPAEDNRWTLGIDELLAYVLPPPREIEFCGLNTKLIQNQLIGKMHTEVGTIPLIVPLSGKVIQINQRLNQSPELVQQDPYKEGWLAVIESFQNHSTLKRSYTGPAKKRFLEEEAQHLRFLLKHRGIEVDNIGDTLPDGGVSIKYLHQILPNQVCLRLSIELIFAGNQSW
jgi:glycine cleavage system H protein